MSKQNRARIIALKRRVAALDLICTGSLAERMKVCGKPNCRCATDPSARHGPYYDWSRRVEGRLRHRALSADEAQRIRAALDNYQLLLTLLDQWEDESIRIILGGTSGPARNP